MDVMESSGEGKTYLWSLDAAQFEREKHRHGPRGQRQAGPQTGARRFPPSLRERRACDEERREDEPEQEDRQLPSRAKASTGERPDSHRQKTTFGLRNRVAELTGRVDPERHRFLSLREGFLRRLAVG